MLGVVGEVAGDQTIRSLPVCQNNGNTISLLNTESLNQFFIPIWAPKWGTNKERWTV